MLIKSISYIFLYSLNFLSFSISLWPPSRLSLRPVLVGELHPVQAVGVDEVCVGRDGVLDQEEVAERPSSRNRSRRRSISSFLSSWKAAGTSAASTYLDAAASRMDRKH